MVFTSKKSAALLLVSSASLFSADLTQENQFLAQLPMHTLIYGTPGSSEMGLRKACELFSDNANKWQITNDNKEELKVLQQNIRSRVSQNLLKVSRCLKNDNEIGDLFTEIYSNINRAHIFCALGGGKPVDDMLRFIAYSNNFDIHGAQQFYSEADNKVDLTNHTSAALYTKHKQSIENYLKAVVYLGLETDARFQPMQECSDVVSIENPIILLQNAITKNSGDMNDAAKSILQASLIKDLVSDRHLMQERIKQFEGDQLQINNSLDETRNELSKIQSEFKGMRLQHIEEGLSLLQEKTALSKENDELKKAYLEELAEIQMKHQESNQQHELDMAQVKKELSDLEKLGKEYRTIADRLEMENRSLMANAQESYKQKVAVENKNEALKKENEVLNATVLHQTLLLTSQSNTIPPTKGWFW